MKVNGAMASNDGDIVLGWALDGHGILIRSEWDLARYLESGRLKIVLPKFNPPSADLYVYFLEQEESERPRPCIYRFLGAQIHEAKSIESARVTPLSTATLNAY